MRNKKAFTLIELVSVLVILAILALIVTPLVLNIIKKARISADKRSIDAYGRSIEIAIADYLLDNGTFPTSIEELTIEYSGDRVACSTTQLNSDSSVYLAGCTVNNRAVSEYTYGKEEAVAYKSYNIGDTLEYKGIGFYVLENSIKTDETVTLLKAEPLSYEEIQDYATGTGAYTTNQSGYGGIQYHSSSNEYSSSYVKIVVDKWVEEKLDSSNVVEARLITLDELINNLGYVIDQTATTLSYIKSSETPGWTYNSEYFYWTMSAYEDSQNWVWRLGVDGVVTKGSVDDYIGSYDRTVRPVVTLKKSAL